MTYPKLEPIIPKFGPQSLNSRTSTLNPKPQTALYVCLYVCTHIHMHTCIHADPARLICCVCVCMAVSKPQALGKVEVDAADAQAWDDIRFRLYGIVSEYFKQFQII